MPFDTIAEGHRFTHRLLVTGDLIDRYRALSGDDNPLHCDDAVAQANGLPSRIAHGNILGMMVSTLVGTCLPDRDVMLIAERLDFRRPVLPGCEVELTATVVTRSEAARVVELKLVFADGAPEPVATGKCTVRWLR